MIEHPPVFQKCQYCGIQYNIGQVIVGIAGSRYYPDAEHTYWKHCRSEEHQQMMDEMAKSATAHMRQLSNWSELRAKSIAYQEMRLVRLKKILENA